MRMRFLQKTPTSNKRTNYSRSRRRKATSSCAEYTENDYTRKCTCDTWAETVRRPNEAQSMNEWGTYSDGQTMHTNGQDFSSHLNAFCKMRVEARKHNCAFALRRPRRQLLAKFIGSGSVLFKFQSKINQFNRTPASIVQKCCIFECSKERSKIMIVCFFAYIYIHIYNMWYIYIYIYLL